MNRVSVLKSVRRHQDLLDRASELTQRWGNVYNLLIRKQLLKFVRVCQCWRMGARSDVKDLDLQFGRSTHFFSLVSSGPALQHTHTLHSQRQTRRKFAKASLRVYQGAPKDTHTIHIIYTRVHKIVAH